MQDLDRRKSGPTKSINQLLTICATGILTGNATVHWGPIKRGGASAVALTIEAIQYLKNQDFIGFSSCIHT